jgi:hypothetical protein
MWSILDSAAPDVAEGFYAVLRESGALDPDRSAEALHRSVRGLREQDPTDLLRWSPYIHYRP